MKWYQLNKKYAINYLFLLLLSFLYVFPVILTNVFFQDDLGWSLYGGVGFKGDGRPLSEYLALALCNGEPAVDTAPLPLILGVILLSYTLTLYAQNDLGFISNRCALLAIMLFIITNPFLMECLFYRYGSMGVLASLSLPFVIFSIPDTTSKTKMLIYSALLSVALMSLQQIAIGMCLILFMSHIFSLLFQEKKICYAQECLRIAGIGIGAIIYKMVVAPYYVSRSDWRHTASQTLGLSPKSIIAIFQNIFATCQYIFRFLSEAAPWYQIALLLFAIFTIVLCTVLYFLKSIKKGWRKVFDIFFLIFSPVCVFIFSFLPLMILKEQTLKLRIFMVLGGTLFYLGILLFYFTKKHPAYIRPLLLLLIACNFYHYTYIYSFGSVISSQNEYTEYLVYQVAHDLETINANGEFTRLSFIGVAPRSKRTQIYADKYPMTGDLIPRYFKNDSWRGGAYVLHYLQDDLNVEKDTDADREIVASAEPVMANSIYSCYVNDDKIIIAFHDSE